MHQPLWPLIILHCSLTIAPIILIALLTQQSTLFNICLPCVFLVFAQSLVLICFYASGHTRYPRKRILFLVCL